MPRPIRAILFDFGDTLVQFGDIDRAALFRQAAQDTYQLWAQRTDRMPDFRRYYLHQWFALHWGCFKTLLRRREMDSMCLLRRACRKLWLTAPEEFFPELAWHWYQPLARVATLEPATHQTLNLLAQRGYKLAIVSNTFVPGQVLDRHLTQLDLLRFFDHRIYSCDLGYRKPHPRIFQEALRRVGVDAGEAAFVGDTFDADVEGSQAVGMRAIWKRSTRAKDRHAAAPHALNIDRLQDLLQLLATIDPHSPYHRRPPRPATQQTTAAFIPTWEPALRVTTPGGN